MPQGPLLEAVLLRDIYSTVQDLLNGIVFDTCDLNALLQKAREIEVAIQRAGHDNVPVKPNPTHTDSNDDDDDDDDDDCVEAETGEKC